MKQQFKINKYDWYITIYYVIDNLQKSEVIKSLQDMGCDRKTLESIKSNLEKAALDTGFTYSNFSQLKSILVVHKASSIGEFLNTFVHEKNHLVMHICEALDINPYSEEAAHFNGDLTQRIFEEALSLIVLL